MSAASEPVGDAEMSLDDLTPSRLPGALLMAALVEARLNDDGDTMWLISDEVSAEVLVSGAVSFALTMGVLTEQPGVFFSLAASPFSRGIAITPAARVKRDFLAAMADAFRPDAAASVERVAEDQVEVNVRFDTDHLLERPKSALVDGLADGCILLLGGYLVVTTRRPVWRRRKTLLSLLTAVKERIMLNDLTP